jgi:hypothetical protein
MRLRPKLNGKSIAVKLDLFTKSSGYGLLNIILAERNENPSRRYRRAFFGHVSQLPSEQ